MGRWIWKYILLLVLIVTVANVGAQEVATKDALKAAVNTSGTANIKLIASIEMGDETLTISQGTITIDLNGYTLSATRTSDGAATCISVNGGSLHLKNSSTQLFIEWKFYHSLLFEFTYFIGFCLYTPF